MLSWFGKGKKNEDGGYRKDRPPEDDCFPICFDDFHLPCRTNCGHWFCGSCILRFSRSMANFPRFMPNFQQCKCPMCQSLIYNLVPHSPLMIQPEREEADEILGEIEQYNRDNKFIPQKEVDLPRRMGGTFYIITGYILLIGALVGFAREIRDFYSSPYRGLEFLLLHMLECALNMYYIWMKWRDLWDRIESND